MITRSPAREEVLSWQRQLQMAYRSPASLLAALGLVGPAFEIPEAASATFPFRVTRAYASRIRRDDPLDPLLLQVLPSIAETAVVAGYGDDPVGEFALAAGTSLLRKYNGRALLIMTGSCAIHCRYCFRRAYPYTRDIGRAALDSGLDAIAKDDSLSEVILSGGDPLLLDDDALGELFHRLSAISHIRRVRIHSRIPVVLPARMTRALLTLMTAQRFPLVMVIHSNHAHEFDDETTTALRKCSDAGVTMLNQSVLLARVNDNAESLIDLSEKLFSARVLPYYVHLLDRVSGTAHFAVDDRRACALEAKLRATLPGYLVPRFVREIAGESSKTPFRQCNEQSVNT